MQAKTRVQASDPAGYGRVANGSAVRPASSLSSVQISPRKQQPDNYISFAKGGNYCNLKLKGQAPKSTGGRSEITRFTGKSRRALLALINSIDQTECSPQEWGFATFTYPKNYPSARASKKHLDTLIKRMEREFGQEESRVPA